MLNTIFAKKVDMTGRYTPKGERVGVTILRVLPTTVSDLRTKDKHGYTAIRFKIQDSRFNRIREIRTEETIEAGMEIKVEDVLKVGDFVNVAGITKGHGFTGVVKRYGFAGGPRTHGQSDRERAPGSSGSTTTPGRVYKGKRRSGRMGNDRVKVRNLEVLEIEPEKRLITVKGAVPGAKNGLVEVIKV